MTLRVDIRLGIEFHRMHDGALLRHDEWELQSIANKYFFGQGGGDIQAHPEWLIPRMPRALVLRPLGQGLSTADVVSQPGVSHSR